MINYNFEEFTEAGGRFRPVISLGAKSGFGLSSGFTSAYESDVNGAVGVKLFYDKEKNAVAFQFCKETMPGMVGLKLRDKGGYISAQSFIGRFRIEQKKYAGRYEPKRESHGTIGTIFVIDLQDNGGKVEVQ